MLEGVANVRDVGGIPAHEGSIRTGVLLRSAALGSLTELGHTQLSDLGVGTVVDLRTEAEAQGSPDQLPGIDVVALPLLQGAWDPSVFEGGRPDSSALAAMPTLPSLYAGMIAEGGTTFATLAGLVAGSTRPVLVHCTAGKDRTGVAVAILLDAVGADRPAVVADYAASHTNLAGPWTDGMLAMLARLGIPDSPAISDLITASPASAITTTLDELDGRGGALRYLLDHGLSDADAELLRLRLVEP